MQKTSEALLALTLACGTPALAEELWSYEGKATPEHWGELSERWQTCSKGMYQSPIDIQHPVNGALPPLQLSFHSHTESIVNNGHTVQIEAENEDDFLLDEQCWKLKQFHFHAPSENHIYGQSFPLEIHFVHADANGGLAVVAVMVVAGAPNPALENILSALPPKRHQKLALRQRLSLTQLYPADRHYYRFSGSLTTPPCSEGVIWLVMKQPVEASAAQLARFASALTHANNRPLQPLHGRQIVE